MPDNAIRSLDGRRFELRGEVFSKDFMTGRVTRFCPACLVEDEGGAIRPHVRRRGRLEWLLAPVRVCPRHQQPLMERQRDAWDGKARELQLLVPETGADLRALAEPLPVLKPSPLQDYVLGRLQGEKGSDWLDAQGIEQAVRATEMLGAVLRYGVDAKAGEMGQMDWDEAGRAGGPYMSAGVKGVGEVLDLFVNRHARLALTQFWCNFGPSQIRWLERAALLAGRCSPFHTSGDCAEFCA